jgi:hypothetical protein
MILKNIRKEYTQQMLKKKTAEYGDEFYMLFGEQDPEGFDEEERSIKSIISTENPDRVNDIIRADGVKMEDYRKNPVVFEDHDRTRPIAKNIYIKPITQNDGSKALLAKTIFAKTKMGLERLWLHKEGFLNAWSVGIILQEWKETEDQGLDIASSSLLEYSSVGIPMNPEALDVEKVQKLMENDNISQKAKLKILERKGSLQFLNLVYNKNKNYEQQLSEIKSILLEIKDHKASVTDGEAITPESIKKLFKNLTL